MRGDKARDPSSGQDFSTTLFQSQIKQYGPQLTTQIERHLFGYYPRRYRAWADGLDHANLPAYFLALGDEPFQDRAIDRGASDSAG
jgi:hypothetical protein